MLQCPVNKGNKDIGGRIVGHWWENSGILVGIVRYW